MSRIKASRVTRYAHFQFHMLLQMVLYEVCIIHS